MRRWVLATCLVSLFGVAGLPVHATGTRGGGVPIVSDPDAREVRAVGRSMTWLHLVSGDVDKVTYRYAVDGRIRTAAHVPGGGSAHSWEVYGDLGLDRAGRVVQVIGDSHGYLSYSGEKSVQERFWLYDLRAGRARRLVLPRTARGCVVERVALWRRRTVAAANCDGDGAIFIADGAKVTRALELPRLGRFAYTHVELDATKTAVGVTVAYKSCARLPNPGKPCGSFTTSPPARYDAWLLRDGCPPRLIRRTTSSSRPLDAPQFQGSAVYWLEARSTTALLRARRLLPGCGLGPARLALRIGRWEQHVTAAVAGDHVFVARDRDGIRRLPLG